MAAASTSEQEPSEAAKWLDAPMGHSSEKHGLASSSSEEELCVSSGWQFLRPEESKHSEISETHKVTEGTGDSSSSVSTRESHREPVAGGDPDACHSSPDMETQSVKVEDLMGRWLSDIGQDIKVSVDSDGYCQARLCDRNGKTSTCQLVSRRWGREMAVVCGAFATSRTVWEGDTALRVEWKPISKWWLKHPARTWTRHLEALGFCKGTWDSERSSSATHSHGDGTSEAKRDYPVAHSGWEESRRASRSAPTERSSWDWTWDTQRGSPETTVSWGTVRKGKGEGKYKSESRSWKTDQD